MSESFDTPADGVARFDTGLDIAGIPTTGFAFPGALRDELNAAILAGAKTSTTALVVDHEVEGDPFPVVGGRHVVLDSAGRPIAVIETTEVRFARLGDVDLAHAVDEGEGYTSVAEWRAGHESFWHGAEMRAALGMPDFTLDDETEVVLERFRLVADLRAGA